LNFKVLLFVFIFRFNLDFLCYCYPNQILDTDRIQDRIIIGDNTIPYQRPITSNIYSVISALEFFSAVFDSSAFLFSNSSTNS
jgi:hypothetical protein